MKTISNSLFSVPVLLGMLLSAGCREGGAPEADGGSQTQAAEAPITAAAPDPTAGGLTVTPPGGDLEAARFIRITFPTDMVSQSDVGKSAVQPVTMEPRAWTKFTWSSTRSGILETRTIGERDVMRRLRLAPDLRDSGGNEVSAKGWGADFADPALGILGVQFLDADGNQVEPKPSLDLACTQTVEVTFSRDVLPAAVASTIAFIDADSHKRYPVQVALEQKQPDEAQGTFTIEPAEPLPMDRAYWLVVERTGDYTGAHPLPHLRVYPAGRTSGLKLTWSRAYNQPRKGMFLRLGFNKKIDMTALVADAIRIDPPVKISKIQSERSNILVFGDFKTNTVYRVTVPGGIAAADGSKTTEESTVEMEVPLRRPAIVLESGKLSAPVGKVDLGVKLCRTGEVAWQIAKVPPADYAKVDNRLKEFAWFARDDEGNVILDPRDGTVRYVETDFLMSDMSLEVMADGTMKGESGEEMADRKIDWPAACAKPGVYLVELRGKDPEGREIGNRCLVSLSDWLVRHYQGKEGGYLHVAKAADGAPLAGARITAYPSDDSAEPEVMEADEKGFAVQNGEDTAFYIVEYGGQSIVSAAAGESMAYNEDEDTEQLASVGVLFTDGDVYAPGETVRFSGTMRARDPDGKLSLPEERETVLSIQANSPNRADLGFLPPGEPPNEMKVALDEFGMFSGEFTVPENALSDTYDLVLMAEGINPASVHFTVTDFSKPDVNLFVNAPVMAGETATVNVTSRYFHGAPQAGAKVTWRAEWLASDWIAEELEAAEEENPWWGYVFDDRHSPTASHQGVEGMLSALRAKSANYLSYDQGAATPIVAIDRGEAILDAEGSLKIISPCPFKGDSRGHRAKVFWLVEVRGESGEVNRVTAEQGIQFADRALALKAEDNYDGTIRVEPAAITKDNRKGEPFPVGVEVFRREVKVTREAVGEGVVRHRNTPVFESVFKSEMAANASLAVPIAEPGDYVVVAEPKGMPGARTVSAQVIGIDDESDGPVLDDFTAEAIPQKPECIVGSEAEILVRSPVVGWAQVTVETDKLLEVLPPVRLKGSADRIKVPVKKEYFPNCFVRIHVQREGDNGGRPLERFAVCELKVRDPGIELKVITQLASEKVKPRENVSASVQVSSLGKSLAGARVVVGVIDESLLSLGDWQVPDPIASMYPPRRHRVTSARAVDSSWYRFEGSSLSQAQKGFIVGGGDSSEWNGMPLVRENELPKPFWETNGFTDADGKFSFSFEAPDQLTSYRVFAYAISGAEAAGRGETRLRVTQPIRLKPLIPRFLREGDRVELRCRVECDPSLAGGAELMFKADTGDSLRMESSDALKVSLGAGDSKVVSVSAVVEEMMAGKIAEITFTARTVDGEGDAMKVSVPVESAFVERTEIRGGSLNADGALVSEKVLGGLSSDGGARCDLFLSGTRWMPKLVGMASKDRDRPTIADQGGAALGALLMASMDGYLPGSLSRKETVEREFGDVMDDISASMIMDAGFGWLPRWPGGSEPDGATTAIVAMILDIAQQEFSNNSSGLTLRIPERLADGMRMWSKTILELNPSILAGNAPSDFEKCVALAIEAKDYSEVETPRFRALVRDFYDHREKLDLESRCFLALADARLRGRETAAIQTLSPEESAKLLAEIEGGDAPVEFDPSTLGSRIRSEAIRLYAVSLLRQGMGATERGEIARLLQPVLDGSLDLNSQENLWVLLAVRGAIGVENPAPLAGRITGGVAPDVSPNEVTLAWLGHPASELRKLLSQPLKPGVESEWLMLARHSQPIGEAKGGDALTLERALTNLTAPERDGGTASPFAIGDYVLLEYVMRAGRDAYQLELEEHLPASLEMVNPDLPSVRRNFPVPEIETIGLSHVIRRPDHVKLYFEHLVPGESKYAILTQVTGAGDFRWPAAGAVPMYDKRTQASTVDTVIYSKASR